MTQSTTMMERMLGRISKRGASSAQRERPSPAHGSRVVV